MNLLGFGRVVSLEVNGDVKPSAIWWVQCRELVLKLMLCFVKGRRR